MLRELSYLFFRVVTARVGPIQGYPRDLNWYFIVPELVLLPYNLISGYHFQYLQRVSMSYLVSRVCSTDASRVGNETLDAWITTEIIIERPKV